VVQVVASSGARKGGHDQAALDEIELAGELMIAATSSNDDRLANERIDEVLLDRAGAEEDGGSAPRSSLG
jgi:hypothetical protein